MRTICAAFILFAFGVLFSEESAKLAAGDGLFYCDNANTQGKGNLWLWGNLRGFYWDNPSGNADGYPLKIFPTAGADLGLLPYLDGSISSELLSYGFKTPGNVRLKVKATLPNNDKLRIFNVGASLTYQYSLVDEYASIGGYRNSAVGFYAEGLMMSGSSVEWRLLSDVEFIQWKSFLPLKFYLNLGYRFSMEQVPGSAIIPGPNNTQAIVLPEPASWSQYLLFMGLEYKGLATDFFLEYHIEVLNSFKDLQTFAFFDDYRVKNHLRPYFFPYYFSENPMYLTPGMRIKYGNGITLLAALPVMFTKEKGYDNGSLTLQEKTASDHVWTDGFSPFYASWKIITRASFPLRYIAPNSEVIRKFLLMKNRKTKQTMDIDEAIEKKGRDETGKSEDEKIQDDIDKRKKEMLQENLLE